MQHVQRLGGTAVCTQGSGANNDWAPTFLRLPSQLRDGHGDDDRQGNERSGAGDGFPEGRSTGEGHCQVLTMRRDRKFWTAFGMAPVPDEELRSVPVATHFKMTDLLKKFDKNFKCHRQELWKVGPERSD